MNVQTNVRTGEGAAVRSRRSAAGRPARVSRDLDERLRILQANRWLQALPERALRELAAACRSRSCRAGELVAARGRPQGGLLVVISGAVRSSTLSADGREMVYSLVRPGGLWGLVAALDGGGTVHDAHASGDSELLVIPVQAFLRVLDDQPRAYKHFARALCYRLRKAYMMVDELSLASLRQRLARQLCTLAVSDSAEPSALGQARIVLTQEDLAGMVGATRPAVNRELKALQRAGLLEMHYGSITLMSFERLRELCATPGLYEL